MLFIYADSFCLSPGKRDIDGRLATAQTALMVQEETIRRKERERKALSDKVGALERSVASLESEKRQMQVGGKRTREA